MGLFISVVEDILGWNVSPGRPWHFAVLVDQMNRIVMKNETGEAATAHNVVRLWRDSRGLGQEEK
jgi:hypothetical protein